MVARSRKVAPAAVALMAAAAALAAAGPAAAGAPLVKAGSGPLNATLAPGSHSPKINTKWPITVTATLNGKPAHASAIYQFLVDGTPVGPTEYPFDNKHYTFTGHFSDSLVFPAASVGEPITLSVVIKDSGHTVRLNWAISSHT